MRSVVTYVPCRNFGKAQHLDTPDPTKKGRDALKMLGLPTTTTKNSSFTNL